jgi:DNA-binding NarL/FixJ family response regulator
VPRREQVADPTERQTQVLALVAQGLSNIEIGGQLRGAEPTVQTHVSRILVKLGLRDRTQAAVFAYESGGVVPPGDPG